MCFLFASKSDSHVSAELHCSLMPGHPWPRELLDLEEVREEARVHLRGGMEWEGVPGPLEPCDPKSRDRVT